MTTVLSGFVSFIIALLLLQKLGMVVVEMPTKHWFIMLILSLCTFFAIAVMTFAVFSAFNWANSL